MVDLTSMGGTATGAVLAAVLALGAIAFLLFIALYVFSSLAWMTIARKLKYKYAWLAWIPVANGAMVLQLGGFHWAWIFLILIPFLGWLALGVLGIISCWRIFEKRKYPGWLALVPLVVFVPFLGWLASIASLVILGLVAWKDRKKR
jgi:hypothetical protein